MNRLVSSGLSRKWLLFSVIAALWCVAWPVGLLEMTRGYPGIPSLKGDRGAWELVETFAHMSSECALIAAFALVFVLALWIGALRRWMDPDRLATQSLAWVFSSSSLNGCAITFASISFIVPTMMHNVRGLRGFSGLFMGVMIMTIQVLGLLAPFFLWNARTLSQPRLARWWLPSWPGWKTMGLAVVLLLLILPVGFIEAWLAEIPLFGMVGNAVLVIASFLVSLFFNVLWIDAGSFEHAKRDFQLVLRWVVLRQILWQFLVVTFVMYCIFVPIITIEILANYVVPQYAAWSKAHGLPLSGSLGQVWAMSSMSFDVLLGISGVWGIYGLLIDGRLLRVNGVGGAFPRSQD